MRTVTVWVEIPYYPIKDKLNGNVKSETAKFQRISAIPNRANA